MISTLSEFFRIMIVWTLGQPETITLTIASLVDNGSVKTDFKSSQNKKQRKISMKFEIIDVNNKLYTNPPPSSRVDTEMRVFSVHLGNPVPS